MFISPCIYIRKCSLLRERKMVKVDSRVNDGLGGNDRQEMSHGPVCIDVNKRNVNLHTSVFVTLLMNSNREKGLLPTHDRGFIFSSLRLALCSRVLSYSYVNVHAKQGL